uniref:pyrin domain-containing protein 1-like n=1 Tax=Gasterosteus aculeatus aculeatus TaxID=481459 RepID=UPI001A995716|nr:pyrin domain-containing protein 1-like [Gasterosteus aculeatus aculeatus]
MSVKKLLLEVLENLVQDDFKRFKLHLTEVGVEGFEPIYKSRLENADRTDTVGTIVKSYGEQVAVKITVEVLKLIGNCDAAEKLRNEYKAGGGEASSSASAAAPPAPASTMTAREQSVLIAPSFAGATVGTLNIHVQK